MLRLQQKTERPCFVLYLVNNINIIIKNIKITLRPQQKTERSLLDSVS